MPADPRDRMALGLRLTVWLWAVGLAITVVGVALLKSGRVEGANRILAEQVIFATWTLGPPCWFILQHWRWPPPPGEYDRFDAQQSLTKAVWAGVLALLTAIFFFRW